jgi:hypothetical protein
MKTKQKQFKTNDQKQPKEKETDTPRRRCFPFDTPQRSVKSDGTGWD